MNISFVSSFYRYSQSDTQSKKIPQEQSSMVNRSISNNESDPRMIPLNYPLPVERTTPYALQPVVGYDLIRHEILLSDPRSTMYDRLEMEMAGAKAYSRPCYARQTRLYRDPHQRHTYRDFLNRPM